MPKHDCEVGQLINDYGLRCSKDRHAMIALLQRERAWSGTQLMKALRHTAKATVYNNLKQLIKANLITAVDQHRGETFYEWADRKHHDHLICEKCAVPECVPCPMPKLKNHLLELHGLCSQCT
jgi:Fe2+ or Zn2+ uptake regulation protein